MDAGQDHSLGGQCTHEQAKQLAFVLAQLISQQLPEIASIARSPRQRTGKVYIDAIQNGYGKLLVAPFSVRARAGATVSTPLRWREVNAKLDPAALTLETIPKRLRRLRSDPWQGGASDPTSRRRSLDSQSASEALEPPARSTRQPPSKARGHSTRPPF